jgi:hypothetical protein
MRYFFLFYNKKGKFRPIPIKKFTEQPLICEIGCKDTKEWPYFNLSSGFHQKNNFFKPMVKATQPAVFTRGSRKDSHRLIHGVLKGLVLAVEIRNYLSEKECDDLVSCINGQCIDATYLHGTAKKIGVSAHNCQDDQPRYFRETDEHPLLKAPVVKKAIKKFLKTLSKGAGQGVKVAVNEKGQPYSPTIMRDFSQSLKLHNDLASRELRGYNPIENVKAQYAFVVKLTECEGGSTYFYPKKWAPEDEEFFNHDDNYSYDMEIVKNEPELEIAGPKGTLIVFDCTHYHRVSQVITGNRYTMGGFIGVLPSNEIVVWS